MVTRSKTKINKVGSRHTIYIRKNMIEDGLFPFKVGETLEIRIEGDTLIIERKQR